MLADIGENRQLLPTKPNKAIFCLLYAQSMCNKTEFMREYVKMVTVTQIALRKLGQRSVPLMFSPVLFWKVTDQSK